jgi:hypothetical protein
MARFITIETNRLGAYIPQNHRGRPLIRAIAVLAYIFVINVLLTILRSLTTTIAAAIVRSAPLLSKTTIIAV